MTYFGFLIRFVVIPIILLMGFLALARLRGKMLPPYLRDLPGWVTILVHVFLAVVWTTPWDNYLVATGVWYYDPELVTGIVLGWVPIEEYTFFVVQTIMTGLWLLLLAHLLPQVSWPPARRGAFRIWAAAILGIVWAIGVGFLIFDWGPGAYLGLELGWMLPPIILQLAVGADTLWHQRRLVLAALLPATLYLAATDALAIGSGTWTIDPAQSTGVMLGALPVEELIFFTLTNTLIVFGMTLLLSYKTVLAQLSASHPQRASSQPTPESG
jgi:lycopene cyclase domain-containing protein